MGMLDEKVALVTGATRGAGRGIAVELAAAGAFVYCTGRSTRAQRSEMDRPETIEETVEIIEREGGRGAAVQVDHLEPSQVEALVTRIERYHGRLDLLINDIWGGDKYLEWNVPVWQHSLEQGLRMLRLGIDTHLITSHLDRKSTRLNSSHSQISYAVFCLKKKKKKKKIEHNKIKKILNNNKSSDSNDELIH